MRYRPLGSTGLTVSELGFGCGAVGGLMTRGDPADQRAAVVRALAAGVTYFDTAAMYGDGASETNLGRVLRELDAWDRVVVGTKVRLAPADFGDARGAVRRSLQASLDRLGHDRVDLLQLHNPLGDGADLLPVAVATAEVAPAIGELAGEGRVSFAGFTGLGDSRAVLDAVRSRRFDTVQTYFNAINPSAGYAGASGGAQDFGGLIDAAADAGMGVIGIRVLAAGAVSGSAERAPNASPAGGGNLTAGAGFTDDVERAQRLAALIGNAEVESTLELSLRLALTKAGVSTALVGFSNQSQLEAALAWTERGDLPASLVSRVVDAALP
jgi:L-galactose dehydrogenase/L-glyceraldehyde 3-phosphate reductase